MPALLFVEGIGKSLVVNIRQRSVYGIKIFCYSGCNSAFGIGDRALGYDNGVAYTGAPVQTAVIEAVAEYQSEHFGVICGSGKTCAENDIVQLGHDLAVGIHAEELNDIGRSVVGISGARLWQAESNCGITVDRGAVFLYVVIIDWHGENDIVGRVLDYLIKALYRTEHEKSSALLLHKALNKVGCRGRAAVIVLTVAAILGIERRICLLQNGYGTVIVEVHTSLSSSIVTVSMPAEWRK